MKPAIRLWHDIIERYRSAEWPECVRIARDALEDHPDDLGARLLLARLCTKLGDPHLAQLQYERLLPLAVGQGDLLRALAAQKQLDLLSPGHERHVKRYAAMHQWFQSVGRGGLAGKRAAGAPGNLTTELLRLGGERFAEIAESAHIEVLELEARDVEVRGGLLWVPLYGRMRSYLESTTPGAMSERVVNAGDTLSCAPGRPDVARVRVIPELPTECLAFDPAVLSEMALEEKEDPPPFVVGATDQAASPAVETAAIPDPGASAPPPMPEAPAPAPLPAREAFTPAPDPVSGPAPVRPVPDPVAEPSVAMTAPMEKRSVTRIAISLEDRTAMLGLAGTRVAPIRGTLHSLSAAMILIGFPREEMLPLRRALDNSVARVQLTLDGRVVLHLGVRMAWVGADVTSREGAGESDAIFALEFLSVGVGDHARIEPAIAARGRTGALAA